MFPVEYIYGEWFYWQGVHDAEHSGTEPLLPYSHIEAGSRVEGFCIPRFFLAKSDKDSFNEPLFEKESWQPDRDMMRTTEPFDENKDRTTIFTIEHVPNDPRYVKLKLTNEWKDDHPRFKEVSFLHHSFLLQPEANPLQDIGNERGLQWSNDLHGPVRKLLLQGIPNIESDQTAVFKYPISWPEPAMDWLIRPRPNGWPTVTLIQQIFDSGCHVAPVGRGKRLGNHVDFLEYMKNPGLHKSAEVTEDERYKKKTIPMDETEWRISFSLAENLLGQSMPPVERQVLVLLKMIKKLYFPEVISSYQLKNLLFWERERGDELSWVEDDSAKCLLFMLDRLHECLEKGYLPHYIIPQSNLLKYENPVGLAEAAHAVAEVRRNIVQKVVSLLKRLHSLTINHILFFKI